jgi:hypothetical protein
MRSTSHHWKLCAKLSNKKATKQYMLATARLEPSLRLPIQTTRAQWRSRADMSSDHYHRILLDGFNQVGGGIDTGFVGECIDFTQYSY